MQLSCSPKTTRYFAQRDKIELGAKDRSCGLLYRNFPSCRFINTGQSCSYMLLTQPPSKRLHVFHQLASLADLRGLHFNLLAQPPWSLDRMFNVVNQDGITLSDLLKGTNLPKAFYRDNPYRDADTWSIDYNPRSGYGDRYFFLLGGDKWLPLPATVDSMTGWDMVGLLAMEEGGRQTVLEQWKWTEAIEDWNDEVDAGAEDGLNDIEVASTSIAAEDASDGEVERPPASADLAETAASNAEFGSEARARTSVCGSCWIELEYHSYRTRPECAPEAREGFMQNGVHRLTFDDLSGLRAQWPAEVVNSKCLHHFRLSVFQRHNFKGIDSCVNHENMHAYKTLHQLLPHLIQNFHHPSCWAFFPPIPTTDIRQK